MLAWEDNLLVRVEGIGFGFGGTYCDSGLDIFGAWLLLDQEIVVVACYYTSWDGVFYFELFD
jgi:hypothetical protein